MKVMRRWKTCLILIGCLAVLLCGCGKSGQKKDEVKRPDLKSLESAMVGADTTLPKMAVVRGSEKDAELNFTALSDLDYDKVEDYFYTYAKDGGAEEIAVVRLKKEDDVAEMMDSITDHVKQRKGTMEQYSPEEVTMVDNAVVTYAGRDVTLIISGKNGLVQKEFLAEDSE